MPMAKGQKVDVEPLTPEEFEVLDRYLDPPHWRTFYWGLWQMGVRVSELLSVQVGDLIFDHKDQLTGAYVDRLKKRKKKRRDAVPLEAELAVEIRQLLPPEAPPTFHIFGHKDGRPLTAAGAWDALKRAGVKARAAGETLRASVHPHLYRHGFGRRIAQLPLTDSQGRPLSALEHAALLAGMMAHESTNTTQTYFRPSTAEVNEAWTNVRRTSRSKAAAK